MKKIVRLSIKSYCILGIILIGIISNVKTQAASFQGLGDLPGGVAFSEATAISFDGSTVVGNSSSAFGTEAFRWTQSGGMVGLSVLPSAISFHSKATGVSQDGSVVVGESASGSGGEEAFRWTQSGGMTGLGFLTSTVFNATKATGVSANGSVVVGNSATASSDEAFRWTQSSGMTGLGDLPGGATFSQATGISGDGSTVVGDSISASGPEAFRWTQSGGITGLGDLPGGGFQSQATAISSDGTTVVGNSASSSGIEPFLWTQSGGMVGLGNLPGGNFDGTAFAISSDGSTAVGISHSTIHDSSGDFEPFIWRNTIGLQSLEDILISLGVDLTGWDLKSADSVSDDGNTIVGSGINPDGKTEAWIANLDGLTSPVPEPASWMLIFLGITVTMLLAKKKS